MSLASAAVADPLSKIQERLTNNPIVCAVFSQSKSLRALTRPLLSRGKFVFVAGKGVLWQVREPFPAQVLVKRDALIKWSDDGRPQRVSFGQTPIFKALSNVFLATFSGDINGLRDTFFIKADELSSPWRLTLTPRNQAFAKIITAVRVTGDRFVNELVIEEARGDKTHIKFSGVDTETCQLGEAEKGYLAH